MDNKRITLCMECHERHFAGLRQRQDVAQTAFTGVCFQCKRKRLVRRYLLDGGKRNGIL